MDQLWVVVAEVEVVIARLMHYKNFTAEQARARMVTQLSNEARLEPSLVVSDGYSWSALASPRP